MSHREGSLALAAQKSPIPSWTHRVAEGINDQPASIFPLMIATEPLHE